METHQNDETISYVHLNTRDLNAALQPFRLVKYFAFTSFIVILFASFILSWTISNNAKKILLERSEAYSQLFAENLNRQVFLQFVLPTVVRYGHIALSNKVQFDRLDIIVRNITKGMKIDSLTIFDSRENIISYSTIPKLVGKKNVGKAEYKIALEGKDNSVLKSNGSLINLLPGTNRIYCKLKTYIPFRQEDKFGERKGSIMGVIEVVKDLSEELKAIIELQSKIIVLSMTIMCLLLAVLSIIVARGSRIIEKRARERRRLEKKLHEAERLASIGKMVAAVAHEIKNPLGIVRSTAEILGKRLEKVAPGNEHLASIIVEETTRLDTIVSEFLDFAKPSEPKFKPASINDLVDRLIRFIQPELEQKSVSINKNLDVNLSEVLMDSEQIYQVLLNIVFNSIQAMPEGGTITITTKPGKNNHGGMVEIKDTGTGMSEQKINQIFTPFFTDKHKGTGLGLSIAKKIIEKHQGVIEVTSRENKGSTFSVSIGTSQ